MQYSHYMIFKERLTIFQHYERKSLRYPEFFLDKLQSLQIGLDLPTKIIMGNFIYTQCEPLLNFEVHFSPNKN